MRKADTINQIRMNCSRCGKPLKRGYFYNGKPYGPDCIVKVAGRKVRLSKLKAIEIDRETEKSDLQMGLFND